MKKFCQIAFVLMVLLSSCQDKNLQIVSNQSTDYVIVIPENADSLVEHAADEIQYYMEAVSGAKPEIRKLADKPAGPSILVGWPVEAKETKPATVHISVSSEQLNIGGGNSRSVLNAVYFFLERYANIRFLTPGAEVIPENPYFSVPGDLDFSYTPEITTRTVHSRLFYNNPSFAAKHFVTQEAFPRYVPGARVHTFHRFLPESVFFDKHPEYYALRNEERRPTQLCLTNPEVFKLVVEAVDSLLKANPGAEVISVSQDDNTQYCQCEECKAINKHAKSPAGSVIDFVNRVARKFPDKQISTLAYQYTRKAPENIKPEDNVLITLCSIECDRSAPINEKCRDFAQDLEDWGTLTDNIRIWDYTTQFTNFLAPFPNLHTLKPNIQLFRDNHAKWVFEQHSYNPSELFELRSYLTAKLLWNPDADADSIISEFLKGYYQEAAPFIQKYISKVHKEIKADSDFFLFLYGDPSQAFDSFLSPDHLIQYDNWYEEAQAAVAGKPEILERVKRAGLSVDFALLEAARQQISPEIGLVQTNDDGSNTVSVITHERLERFKNVTREGNITLLNEMGYTIDEYVGQYSEMLKRAGATNLAYQKPVELLTSPKKYANEDPRVLTDGAFGGPNFYANWLGFEGNHMEAIIDLEKEVMVSEISTAFLKVTNHLVFYPEKVQYLTSKDGTTFSEFGVAGNQEPLTRKTRKNDIRNFTVERKPQKTRYIKIIATNILTPPYWHHGTGLPAWIFADEVMVR
ncbi:DUF4838 domain-containing protein [Marinilabilia rubra]|uniref:DUF4838 domain-containing protein n=1 Tax=Marinilabilia rubra TaxID=2162893 RepID=A0A2U2B398_9BACT|nr:DUF4838 domain-containing protein [Marinilabilia rubra]PWD97530.1 hypothetical protein DDZ16_20300 [Marinilabilia rubra]